MLSRKADAFEDAATSEDEHRRARYENALSLLDEQTEQLLGSEPPTEAHHAPYRPHWRGLSSAARRLVRAHEHVEEETQED